MLGGVEEKLDIVSAFQSYGQSLAGSITEAEREAIVAHACPGAHSSVQGRTYSQKKSKKKTAPSAVPTRQGKPGGDLLLLAA